ncbi:hypothetical protein I7X12_03615 [Halosimplex litoreum]|uniref:Uncharacterized protein n=1 Tax=Halosimplex litoreum TaxID=1198301 RepID=A0A7T3FZY8_9EURY|nr:hypothetical protein [Halosimplex litoreum]QPV63731.1 hypothetical protein I7X12_03615 [Halosimplex litoreum]
MSALPDEWAEPGSSAGTLVDLAWVAVCVLGFGALAAVEPLFFEVPVTTTRVAVAALLGVPLAVALVVLSTESERARALWTERYTRRFAVLFAFSMGMQLLLRLAPGWTVLVTLATALAAIPLRVVAYYHHRRR